jgi:hypothetical protein
VDLFWEGVQADLRAAAGPIDFVLGADWTSRFDGRLRIAHGHQHDLANQFRHWAHPFVSGPGGEQRLEMCPGTLFMVKFVNWLEGNYPFADNIKPVSALWRILARENTLGLASIGWMFARFAARHPGVTLGDKADARALPENWWRSCRRTTPSAPRSAAGTAATWTAVPTTRRSTPRSPATRSGWKLMIAVMAGEPPGAWEAALAKAPVGGTLGAGQGTLQLAESQKMDDKLLFREVAKAELTRAGSIAEVVVLGHTHCPDDWAERAARQALLQPGLVDALRRNRQADHAAPGRPEERSGFPYALNYVRITAGPAGLDAQMLTHARCAGGL